MWMVKFRYHGFENLMMKYFSTEQEAREFANTCNYLVLSVQPKS
jgi:hypothetical protein